VASDDPLLVTGRDELHRRLRLVLRRARSAFCVPATE
jgi:hypothetical protein